MNSQAGEIPRGKRNPPDSSSNSMGVRDPTSEGRQKSMQGRSPTPPPLISGTRALKAVSRRAEQRRRVRAHSPQAIRATRVFLLRSAKFRRMPSCRSWQLLRCKRGGTLRQALCGYRVITPLGYTLSRYAASQAFPRRLREGQWARQCWSGQLSELLPLLRLPRPLLGRLGSGTRLIRQGGNPGILSREEIQKVLRTMRLSRRRGCHSHPRLFADFRRRVHSRRPGKRIRLVSPLPMRFAKLPSFSSAGVLDRGRHGAHARHDLYRRTAERPTSSMVLDSFPDLPDFLPDSLPDSLPDWTRLSLSHQCARMRSCSSCGRWALPPRPSWRRPCTQTRSSWWYLRMSMQTRRRVTTGGRPC
mmetsp:Transcript_29387/g.72382  ORF Transcript_29387/g.72382 Transcript_29387/m.72382 type:complete len:359 (+) Transcript_29387:331-1407(+)